MDSAVLDEKFAPASFEDWQLAAVKAAKSTNFEALYSVVEGLNIAPLAKRAAERTPILMKRPHWVSLQRVDDPDVTRAAAQANADISNGADGLALVFEGAGNAFGRGLPATKEALFTVLENIDLERCALRIDAHPAIRKSAEWMVDFIEKKRPNTRKLRLAAGIDQASIFAASGRLGMSFEALKASLPQSLTGFFATGLPGILLEADARPVHLAGGTAAQELGFALSIAVGHLRMAEEARQPAGYAAPSIGFVLCADQDFALTIAKLRAVRLLWGRVLGACDAELAQPVKLHVETSRRMMSAQDPDTNILRNTIALSAAVFGGADSISVLPHTTANGLPDNGARRIACMQHLIARDESHLGSVMDVASGSGSIEALTDALCEAAWAEFQKIEACGGPLAALASGRLQADVKAAREALTAKLQSTKIIGVNAFQLKNVAAVLVLDHPEAATEFPSKVFCEKLPVWSIDAIGSAP